MWCKYFIKEVSMGCKTEQYRDIVVPIINKHLPNAKILLYGSRARCEDHPASNIDIAIDAGHLIGETIMGYIRSDVEESELPIAFNIVDFNAVSAKMQETILEDAITWYK
jgi:predicted nucleotidyltransferase